MKAKKRIAVFVAALALASVVAVSSVAFTGCGGSTINVAGSTSMKNVMSALADAYMAETGNTINLNFNGSGEGISAAQKNEVDFGLASRDLKEDETGVKQVTIAVDGIALIVKADSSIEAVSMAEVYNLYHEGTTVQSVITTPITRESGSGTRSAFEEIVKSSSGTELGEDGLKTGITETTSTETMITTVSGNAAAMGYASYSEAKAAEDDGQVKILKYDNVLPSNATIGNGSYKLARNFNLILPGNGYSDLSDAAKDFSDFIASEDGIKIIEEENLVTVDIPAGEEANA